MTENIPAHAELDDRRLIRQVSERIVDLRKQAGLKQITMADMMKISVRHYQKIEHAEVDLNLSMIDRAAKALGVRADQLLAPQFETVSS